MLNLFKVSVVFVFILISLNANSEKSGDKIQFNAVHGLRGGDDMGNGAGMSESNFAFAFFNMQVILKNLLLNKEIQISPAEDSLINKILQGLDDEYKDGNKLYFATNSEIPFKLSECRGKIACTFDGIGSRIFVNLTAIRQREYKLDYVLLPEASAIIAHEFGHHHGVKDEEFLINFEAKVRLSMSHRNDSMVNRWWQHKHIYSLYQNFTKIKKAYISINDDMSGIHLDLSHHLTKHFNCPQKSEQYIGNQVIQMIWEKDAIHRSWMVRFDLVQYCQLDGVVNMYESETLQITPVFTYGNKRLNLTGFIPEYKSCNYGNDVCLMSKVTM